MSRWVNSFQQSNPQTKYFFIVCILFGAAIVFSTLFAYGRLDYVRSDQTTNQKNTNVTP